MAEPGYLIGARYSLNGEEVTKEQLADHFASLDQPDAQTNPCATMCPVPCEECRREGISG